MSVPLGQEDPLLLSGTYGVISYSVIQCVNKNPYWLEKEIQPGRG
jgi:hypothetical protein